MLSIGSCFWVSFSLFPGASGVWKEERRRKGKGRHKERKKENQEQERTGQERTTERNTKRKEKELDNDTHEIRLVRQKTGIRL